MMAALTGVVSATPTCTTGTLASYIDLDNTGGCTIGDFTFNNFAFPAPVTAGNPTVATASEITVTPFNTSAGPGVSFGAMVNGKNLFSISTTSQTQSITYFINYLVDPGPVIRGESLSMDPPFGAVKATQEYTSASGVSLGRITVTPDIPNDSISFPFLVSRLGVQTCIDMEATPGHPAGFDGIDAGNVTVPEPAGVRLLLTGLTICALLFVRRLRKPSRANP
jgi:hypothetical protein